MTTPDFTPMPSLYPFTSRWFPSAAGRMHYVDEGAGRPLLLLHGNPTWSFLYRDVIRRLAGRFRCIAVDYLGFGLSERPPGFGYTPAEHAAAVRRRRQRRARPRAGAGQYLVLADGLARPDVRAADVEQVDAAAHPAAQPVCRAGAAPGCPAHPDQRRAGALPRRAAHPRAAGRRRRVPPPARRGHVLARPA